jgi:hypothetical protein
MVIHVCNLSYAGGIDRRILFKADLSKQWDPPWKNKLKKNGWIQVLEAHTCNPSYMGGWDWEDQSLRPTWGNSLRDPIFKITRAKWTEVFSSSRVPALQAWNPEFKTPVPQKRKRKKSWGHGFSIRPWVQTQVPTKKKLISKMLFSSGLVRLKTFSDVKDCETRSWGMAQW